MQVLRISRLGLLPVIFRCYGTQRPHRNYYEILEVSPNCSQKEIRRAFLALSKKWHPDIVGDKGHDKFVKLQEAYNVLSKENTRKQYDIDLKYSTSSYSSSYARPEYPFNSRRVYRSRREWEEHMARGNWQPRNLNNKSNNSKPLWFLTWFAIFWIILSLQMFFIQNRIYTVKRNLQYEYQNNYNTLRKNIEGLTLDEQIDTIQKRYDISQHKNQEGDEKQK